MDLLQMSFSGAVMILAVTVVRALTMHRLPKRTFLALWGVVLARLLLPFSLPSMFSVYSLLEKAVSRFASAPRAQPVPVPMVSVGRAAGIPQSAAALSPWRIVWACGALVCGLIFAAAYGRCCREFRASLPVQNGFTEEWLRTHPLIRGLSVRQSDRVCTPLTYGILHPVILMPKRVSWENTQALQYVLAHEYVHIRRFDNAKKFILIAAVCAHWFNPLVWVMYVLANRDIELSCDEAVVRLFGEQEKGAYARALIRMEEVRSGLTPLCSNFSKNAIEERITAIMKIRKTTVVSMLIACLIVVGTATAFATSAQPDASLSKEELDRALNAEYSAAYEVESMISYVNPEDGKIYYSTDGGKTFEALTDEEFEQRYPTPEVEWWTYEEYKAWLEEEKVQLQSMIGEKGWTSSRGDFVWTQEMVDEAIAEYESVLEQIKNGIKVSKSVDGSTDVVLSYNPADIQENVDIDVKDAVWMYIAKEG